MTAHPLVQKFAKVLLKRISGMDVVLHNSAVQQLQIILILYVHRYFSLSVFLFPLFSKTYPMS